MAFEVVDLREFLSDSLFSEQVFLEKTRSYDWEKFRGRKVLVRGCDSALIPPWAFMVITGKLAGLAASIRFGNEHDNIVVYRNARES